MHGRHEKLHGMRTSLQVSEASRSDGWSDMAKPRHMAWLSWKTICRALSCAATRLGGKRAPSPPSHIGRHEGGVRPGSNQSPRRAAIWPLASMSELERRQHLVCGQPRGTGGMPRLIRACRRLASEPDLALAALDALAVGALTTCLRHPLVARRALRRHWNIGATHARRTRLGCR
jgi:hypothetical protein